MKWKKDDLVESSEGVQCKCIVADYEYAVFAKTFIDPDEDSIVTDFEDMMVFSNDEEIGKNDALYPIEKVTAYGSKEY